MLTFILGCIGAVIFLLFITKALAFLGVTAFFSFKFLVSFLKEVRWYFRAFLAAVRNDTENKYYKEFKEYEHYLKVYNTLGRRPKPHRSL